MSITLDDLRLIQEVATHGSFSKAAASLRCSQPQVSMRVAQLEQAVGTTLFERHRRGVRCTAACEVLLPYLQRAQAQVEEGLLAVKGVSAIPKITIGCLPSLAHTIFASVLGKLASAPMEITCTTGHSNEVIRGILEDTVQVGFILDAPAMAGIQMELLWNSPILCVAAASHPLAGRTSLTLADIAAYRLAPQNWGDECEILLSTLRRLRSEPMPLHRVAPSNAARALVLEQGFISFMPEMTVVRELRLGSMVRLPVQDLPQWYWRIMMAWRAGKQISPAKQQLLETGRALARALRPLPE